MGQAKRRGTLEDRKTQAKYRVWNEQLKQEKLLAARREQEVLAYKIMTWWQLDMTEERIQTFWHRKKAVHTTAAILHAALGSFGGPL